MEGKVEPQGDSTHARLPLDSSLSQRGLRRSGVAGQPQKGSEFLKAPSSSRLRVPKGSEFLKALSS